MVRNLTVREPNLPWLDDRDDRLFRRLSIVVLLLFIGAGLVLNAIQLPDIEKKNLVDVSPRLARLIMEKQKVKPPPPPPAPVPEKEKQPEKAQEKPKPEKKQEKKEVKKETAREVAEKSGLIALSDELEDLRESFDLDEVAGLDQQTTGDQAADLGGVASTSSLLSASAGQSSGGIKTDTLNRELKTSELAQRKTTSVQSQIDSGNDKLASISTTKKSQSSSQKVSARRTADEIERVFQKNKGAIFSIYQRALRTNPSLAGKVVVELTIAPNGVVTNVDILSSELGDAALERKLALRIKRFKFSQAEVAEIIVTYPIDFLPS